MTMLDTERLERLEGFRAAMLAKLTTERNLSKSDWRGIKKRDLFDLLLDEIVELKAAVRTFDDADRVGLGEFASFATPVAEEAIDVANFAFMLWDVFAAEAAEREESNGGRYQGGAQVDPGVGGRGEELPGGGEEHQEEDRGLVSHSPRGLDDRGTSTQDHGSGSGDLERVILEGPDLSEKTGQHSSGLFAYAVTPSPPSYLEGVPSTDAIAWIGKWSASCSGCGDTFSSIMMVHAREGAKTLEDALARIEAEVISTLKGKGWTFDPPRCHYCVDVHSVIGE
jgi:hypothetical protein